MSDRDDPDDPIPRCRAMSPPERSHGAGWLPLGEPQRCRLHAGHAGEAGDEGLHETTNGRGMEDDRRMPVPAGKATIRWSTHKPVSLESVVEEAVCEQLVRENSRKARKLWVPPSARN